MAVRLDSSKSIRTPLPYYVRLGNYETGFTLQTELIG